MAHIRSEYLFRGSFTAACTLLFILSITINDHAQVCEPSFTLASSPATGVYPAAVAAADLNNDGIRDLAAANFIGESVSILIGAGDGTFAALPPVPSPGNPFSIAAGDLNSDGNADLAVLNYSSNSVTVLHGSGTGAFAVANVISVGQGPYALAAADMNSDGRTDLVSVNSVSNDLSVMLNSPSGFTSAATVPNAGGAPTGLVLRELNGDGNIDAAIANNLANTVTVKLGGGDGTFTATSTHAVGLNPQSVDAGDVNNDGALDLVTANSGSGTVSVLLNGPGGVFGPAATFAAGSMPYALSVADMNADGSSDITAVDLIAENVMLLRGNGAGSFSSPAFFATGSQPAAIAVADLDNNGSNDVVTGNTGSGNLSTFLNSCAGGNTSPTVISTSATVGRGTAADQVPIGSVTDTEDPVSDLIVSIDGGSAASRNGVTVSDLSVDALGVIRASVSASCSGSPAAFLLEVTDSGGLSSSAELIVNVGPGLPPVIAPGPALSLFPRNGQLHPVAMSQMVVSAIDACDGDVSGNVTIESVSIDEGDDSDIVIDGGCRSVLLRAEREAKGDGRVYSVTLRVADSDGTVARADFTAFVPIHPKGKFANAGPPMVTVAGGCAP